MTAMSINFEGTNGKRVAFSNSNQLRDFSNQNFGELAADEKSHLIRSFAKVSKLQDPDLKVWAKTLAQRALSYVHLAKELSSATPALTTQELERIDKAIRQLNRAASLPRNLVLQDDVLPASWQLYHALSDAHNAFHQPGNLRFLGPEQRLHGAIHAVRGSATLVIYYLPIRNFISDVGPDTVRTMIEVADHPDNAEARGKLLMRATSLTPSS